MKIVKSIGLSICLMFSSLFINGQTPKSAKKDKPNIIVILTDDLGYGDPVCYGGTKIKTPNIDKLASEGVRFTNGYSPASTCSPSRYALLTGQYAWRKNVGILPGNAPMSISSDMLTLPGMLKQCGYTTGIAGKWHLGLGNGNVNFNEVIKPSPNDIGFDYSFYYPATNDRVPCVYIENGKVVGLDPNDPIQVSYGKPVGNWPTGKEHPELLKLRSLIGHNQTIVNGIGRIGYMTGGTSALWKDEEMAEVFTGKAVEFIRQNAEKPFFLYFATHNIHEPRVPGPKFRGTSECGIYGDGVEELDWSVGEILKTLKEKGLDKNTLIVFLSDNGPRVAEGYVDGAEAGLNGHTPAANLRGDKGTLYEGGTRTPFIVHWPEKIKPLVSNAPIGFIDLFASFAHLLDFKLTDIQAPDSRNGLSVLLGKARKTKYNEVLIQDNGGKIAIRSGHWKFIPKESKPDSGEDELYNLSKDISESKNLAPMHPKLVSKFYERIKEIKASKGYGK
jgi:arylsulfatase A-like enzyme